MARREPVEQVLLLHRLEQLELVFPELVMQVRVMESLALKLLKTGVAMPEVAHQLPFRGGEQRVAAGGAVSDAIDVRH